MNDGVFGVARGEKNLQVRPLLQDDVGEEQIESLSRLDDRKRLSGVSGLQRDVAQRAQLGQHILANEPVVFDDEDGLMSAFDLRDGTGLEHERWSSARRQVHLDRGAVAFLAIDLDVAGRLLDESV